MDMTLKANVDQKVEKKNHKVNRQRKDAVQQRMCIVVVVPCAFPTDGTSRNSPL